MSERENKRLADIFREQGCEVIEDGNTITVIYHNNLPPYVPYERKTSRNFIEVAGREALRQTKRDLEFRGLHNAHENAIQYFLDTPIKLSKKLCLEETMNPEKEASKCQEESFAEQARRIAKEEIDKALKDFKWRIDDSGAEPQFAPELTQKENNILKGLHFLGWSWIARDVRGLCVYEEKPVRRDPATWDIDGDDDKFMDYNKLPISKSLPEEQAFTFVQQSDKEPTLIADLIDWSDDE